MGYWALFICRELYGLESMVRLGFCISNCAWAMSLRAPCIFSNNISPCLTTWNINQSVIFKKLSKCIFYCITHINIHNKFDASGMRYKLAAHFWEKVFEIAISRSGVLSILKLLNKTRCGAWEGWWESPGTTQFNTTSRKVDLAVMKVKVPRKLETVLFFINLFLSYIRAVTVTVYRFSIH